MGTESKKKTAAIRLAKLTRGINEKCAGNQSSAAKLLNWPATDISRYYLTGKHGRTISDDKARHFEDTFGYPKFWMDTESDEVALSAVVAKISSSIVNVPIFEVTASMGLGAAMPEHDTVVDTMRLTNSWVRNKLPAISGTSNLAVISAYGDSMMPTFNNGDLLLVDRGVSDFKVDTVYVIVWHGELYIKRVQRRGTELAIISDNKALYEPIPIPATERRELKVLGRVVWAWNGREI